MPSHPDLASEQAHVALAYERLAATRAAAEQALRAALGQGGVGTPQALVERDVMVANALERIERLAVGDEAICFGRIDRDADRVRNRNKCRQACSPCASVRRSRPRPHLPHG